MTNEEEFRKAISVTEDREGNIIIGDSIDFGIIKAGESVIKSIFLKNKITSSISITVTLTADDIKIVKDVRNLGPEKQEELKFEISPEITTMEAVKGKITFAAQWVLS